MSGFSVPEMVEEDYKTCAIRALLEMFAEARNVPVTCVGLVFTHIEGEHDQTLIQPVVLQ